MNLSPRMGDPLSQDDHFDENTYYQILLVEPSLEKTMTTSILAKKRGKPSEDSNIDGFAGFELDQQTIDKLSDYPRHGRDKENKLSSYLPSMGVMLEPEFINTFCTQNNDPVGLGNFYVTMRLLLHSRKISQLIAKTWCIYLEAKGDTSEEKFLNGEWDNIDTDILDGLIAREIFLYGGADSPDYPDDSESSNVYSPLKPGLDGDKKRFLILPNSKAWQGISLSLLLAGQAYYKVKEGGKDKYHQIHPSILSTGEITMQYTLEVDWSRFTADIKEVIISNEKPWVAYHVLMPYPPIPDDADKIKIRTWAEAKEDPEEENQFPFYKKDKNGKYLIDVDCFRPPYPYIPLSST